jgi:hypothetical protein
MARSTLSRVSLRIGTAAEAGLSTRDTVATDTPAAAATSRMLTAPLLLGIDLSSSRMSLRSAHVGHARLIRQLPVS